MFGINNLKQNPFISTEMDFPKIFEAPPAEDVSCSDWLLMAIEDNKIEKIYAMRVLPLHDLLAFKIKYYSSDKPRSEIISQPELHILKRIWDCGNSEFNRGISHYLQNSKHANYQYRERDKFLKNTPEINSWYFTIFLGRDV